MAKQGCCWCGKRLVSGKKCEDGTWFPFGFLNCITHGCWYESKEEYNKHLVDEALRATKTNLQEGATKL